MNEHKILYQIRYLEKLILREIFDDNQLPHPTQMQIIGYIINNKGETYQKDLEQVLNLRRATVSGVLKTMEKNNLIKRVSDSNDGRIKKIVLNNETNNIFIQNKKRMEKLEKVITKDIEKKDLETFSKVLNKMRENVKGNHI